MTAATLNRQAPVQASSAGPALRVTQARVLRSEWTKFRSLRSTMWTLLVAVVLTIGIGAAFSAIVDLQWDNFSLADRAKFTATVISLNGIQFSQLAVGVLAVLMISGEYSTGMIRSSLTVVPKRLPTLWAKLAVFAAVSFVVMFAASLVSFFLGQTLLSGHNIGASITDPTALRSVVGASLYVTVAGLIGLALGTLVRNTAGAISAFVGVFFVLPPLTQLLPSSWSSHFVQYLPSNAGEALYGGTRDLANALSPWTGFAVLAAYAVILIGAAAWRLKTTDA
jgi:ABC-2 type transport system permease protein